MGQAKKKQQRDCPALGKVITPAECGQGRNSEISCPLDCPHNPFALANYDAFLDLEGKVIDQLSMLLAREGSPTLMKEIEAALESNDLFAMQSILAWRFYGQGLVAKWMEEGRFEDWKNDEQVMVDYLATSRPALIEFHEMRDELSWVGVDLLRPGEGPFLIVDSGAAARAARHDVILAWVYDIPAGKKIAVSAREVPAVGDFMPLEVWERTLQHLEADEAKRDLWIQENMILLSDAFAALSKALREEREYRLQLRETLTNYSFEPEAYNSIAAVLEANPRLVLLEGEPAVPGLIAHILAGEEESKVPGVAEVQGTLDLEGESSTLCVSTFEEGFAARCRSFVESLGLPLVFEDEETPEPAHPKPDYDKDLVDADLFDRAEIIDIGRPKVRLDDHSFLPTLPLYLESTFADESHVLLDGTTPRQAAQDSKLRTRLIALMKGYFRDCDKRRRHRGEDLDVGPLALELGLQEIVFPAPPLGVDNDEFDEEFAEVVLTPPPPQPQLDGEEVARRVGEVLSSDESLQRHQLRLIAIFEALKAAESGFNFDERMALFAAITAAIGSMHPEEPEGFLPDTERMVEWYRQRLSTGQADEMLDDYMTRIAAETRQPEVVEAAYRMIANAADARRLKIRSKRLEQLYTAACAAIWEAAHWPVKLP